MTDINLRFKVTSDGVEVFDQVGSSLAKVDSAGKQASSGLDAFTKGAANLVSTAEGMIAGATAAAALVDKVNDIGVASLRAHAGLDAMSDGKSVQFLKAMTEATRGLVDDTDLAHDATLALSSGLITTSQQAAKLAEDGAALGRIFQNSGQQGVQTLIQIEEMVGSKRGLKQLGLDADVVMDKFEHLKATGMDMQTAWNTAVMDAADASVKKLGESAYGAGTSIERLKIQFQDFGEAASENVAKGLESTIQGFTDIINHASGADNPKQAAIRQAQLAQQTTIVGYDAMGLPTYGASDQPSAPFGGPPMNVSIGSMGSFAGATPSMGAPMGDEWGATSSTGAGHDLQKARQFFDFAGGLAKPYEQAATHAEQLVKQNLAIESAGMQISHWWSQTTASMQQAVGPLQEQVKLNVENAQAMERNRGMTVNQVTGGKDNALASDVFSGMDAAFQQHLKGTSYSKRDSESADYKKMVDDIAISTGQITKEGIQARDSIAGLNASFAKGSIDLATYSKSLTTIYKDLEAGRSIMGDVTRMNLQQEIDNMPAYTKTQKSNKALQAHALGEKDLGSADDPSGAYAGAAKLNSTLDLTGAKADAAGAKVAAMPGPSAALSTADALQGRLNAIASRAYVANVVIRTFGSVPSVNSTGDTGQ